MRKMAMARSYAELQKQIETLQREAANLKRQEIDEVIARIKEAIDVYGLTPADLGFQRAGRAGTRKRQRKVSKAATTTSSRKGAGVAKFKDASGNVWGGRGPRPAWLREALAAGHSLEEYRV
jgi:DNA-binding protein H-NS